MGIILRNDAKKNVNLALILQEWVKLKARKEYAENRLIYYSKEILECEKETEELQELLKEVGEVLGSMEYKIFYKRYIEQKKIWEIAQETKYSESHTKRIIKNIKNKLKDTKMTL